VTSDSGARRLVFHREPTPREVFVNGVNEGSSELALTVDEERNERSE